MQKDPQSLWKEPLDDALSIGDLPWARQILRDVKKGMTPARWEAESEGLKKHILSKHPLGKEQQGSIYLLSGLRRKGQIHTNWQPCGGCKTLMSRPLDS